MTFRFGVVPETRIDEVRLGSDEVKALTTLVRFYFGIDSEPKVSNGNVLFETANAIYNMRRQRRHFFDPNLFFDPAWDMLLAVYSFGGSEPGISITGLCYSSDCPYTTALRWVHKLIELGLLRKDACKSDARRAYVRLTAEGQRRIEGCLGRVYDKRYLSCPKCSRVMHPKRTD